MNNRSKFSYICTENDIGHSKQWGHGGVVISALDRQEDRRVGGSSPLSFTKFLSHNLHMEKDEPANIYMLYDPSHGTLWETTEVLCLTSPGMD